MIHWNETLERAEDDTKILSKVTGSMELPLTEGVIPGGPVLNRGTKGVQIMSLVLYMQNLR